MLACVAVTDKRLVDLQWESSEQVTVVAGARVVSFGWDALA